MDFTALGVLGILLGLSSVMFVSGRAKRVPRVRLALALAVVQIATAIYFYNWALSNTTDASTYYFDPHGFYYRGFGLSTQFVVWLVQGIKQNFGGTYLDFFLLFQATGTWGVVFILKIFEEVFDEVGEPLPWQVLATLFLPGLHFWTAYIGKDGALFLGAAMAGWAALKIGQRWITFALGIAVMLLFRPHIALLAIAAGAIAIVLDRRTQLVPRLALITLALAGLVVIAGTVRSTFEVDVSSAESVSEFMASRDRVLQGESAALAAGSFPVRVVSLLFRPLFFDAGGLLGLIASFENLVLVLIFGTLVARFRSVSALFSQLFHFRFAALFVIALTILLSMFYYNVGLGLRQKMMMMPAILTIFATVMASRRFQRRQTILRAQPT